MEESCKELPDSAAMLNSMSEDEIKKEQEEGKTTKQMIEEKKGVFSAGKAFNLGLCRIGSDKKSNRYNSNRERKGRRDAVCFSYISS